MPRYEHTLAGVAAATGESLVDVREVVGQGLYDQPDLYDVETQTVTDIGREVIVGHLDAERGKVLDINATTVRLYEDNGDAVYLQANDGDIWNLGSEPADRRGSFATDASMWVDGDWKPGENNGQTLCDSGSGLRLVATWDARDGVKFVVDPFAMDFTAASYLGVTD